MDSILNNSVMLNPSPPPLPLKRNDLNREEFMSAPVPHKNIPYIMLLQEYIVLISYFRLWYNWYNFCYSNMLSGLI